MYVDTVNLELKLVKDGKLVSNPIVAAAPDVAIALSHGQKCSVRSPHDRRNTCLIIYKMGRLIISGSALKWLWGHNVAGCGCWQDDIDIWTQQVVEYVFPGCFVRSSKMTRLDIFAMYLCEYNKVRGAIVHLGTCISTSQMKGVLKRYGVIDDDYISATAYVGYRSKYAKIRAYSKAMQAGRYHNLDVVKNSIRLEVSLLRGWFADRTVYHKWDGWRNIDINNSYYSYLRRVIVADPRMCSGYTGRIREVIVTWKRRKFYQTARHVDSRMRLKIRRDTGYDLRRSIGEYSEYMSLPADDYLTYGDLVVPNNDINAQIWAQINLSKMAVGHG